MSRFVYAVELECESQGEADQVLAERLGYDEDYGFAYRICAWDFEYTEEVLNDVGLG